MTEDRWAALRQEFDQSPYAKLLGLRVLELDSGYAKVGSTVHPAGLDFRGQAHEALVVSLADQAFGTATNTLDPAYHYVAIQFSISFISSPRQGEAMVAEGRVAQLEGGRGVTDMTVLGAGGRVIAKASGIVLAIRR